jgi:hypothetical protein
LTTSSTRHRGALDLADCLLAGAKDANRHHRDFFVVTKKKRS